MIDQELLQTLYKLLSKHSDNWSKEINSIDFIVQETHKISGKPRTDVTHIIRMLEDMEILVLTSKSPLIFTVNPIPLEELQEKIANTSIVSYRTDDLFQLLDLIERRSGMFLLEARLDYLYVYLSGYSMAVNSQQDGFTNLSKLDQFSQYLHSVFESEYQNTMGWFGTLSYKFGKGEKGLEMFFHYFWEFRLQEETS
jgi:hypothetical protein